MRALVTFAARCGIALLGCSYEPIDLPESPSVDAAMDDASDDLSTAVRLKLEPYSSVATRWNDYVLAADHEALCPQATPAADCVHAGAWCKVVFSDEDSCSNLIFADEHGWFDWECGSGTGEVVLTGRLRAEIGLADVIDQADLSWRSSTLLIERDGAIIAWAESVLWEDPVRELPEPIGGMIELDEPYAVYVARAAAEGILRVSADGVALLDASGVARRALESADVLEIDPGLFFLWIEGISFDVSDGAGIAFSPLSNSGVRNLTVVRDEVTPIATDAADLRILVAGSTITGMHSFAAAGTGISIEGTHNVLQDIEVADATGDGVVLQLADSFVSDIRASQVGRNGVLLQGTTATTLANVSAADCDQNGLLVDHDSHHDTLADVVVANNGEFGIVLQGSDHRMALVLSASNHRSGVRVEGRNNLLMHATTPSNGFVGLQVGASVTLTDEEGNPVPVETTGTQIVNVVSTNNMGGLKILVDSEGTRVHDAWLASNQLSLVIDASYNVFTGTLALGPAESCAVSAMFFVPTEPGIVATPCAIADDSTAAITLDNTLGTANGLALVGHRRESDPFNDSVDSNGSRDYAAIADWFSFSHRHRHWGKHLLGPTLPNADSFGRCVEGSACGYWDWRVTNEDSSIRDPLTEDPDGFDLALEKEAHVRTHVWSASTEESCGAIDGAEWTASSSECTSRFVAYAYEPIGDKRGNDNMLCEPDERCILNRNRGAYPGHGEYADLDPGVSKKFVDLPGFGSVELEMFNENGP